VFLRSLSLSRNREMMACANKFSKGQEQQQRGRVREIERSRDRVKKDVAGRSIKGPENSLTDRLTNTERLDRFRRMDIKVHRGLVRGLRCVVVECFFSLVVSSLSRVRVSSSLSNTRGTLVSLVMVMEREFWLRQ